MPVDEALDVHEMAAAATQRDMALAGLFDALAALAREGVKFLAAALESERAG